MALATFKVAPPKIHNVQLGRNITKVVNVYSFTTLYGHVI